MFTRVLENARKEHGLAVACVVRFILRGLPWRRGLGAVVLRAFSHALMLAAPSLGGVRELRFSRLGGCVGAVGGGRTLVHPITGRRHCPAMLPRLLRSAIDGGECRIQTCGVVFRPTCFQDRRDRSLRQLSL